MAENTLAGVLFFGGGIVITALIIALMNRKRKRRKLNKKLPGRTKAGQFPFYPFRGFISDSP